MKKRHVIQRTTRCWRTQCAGEFAKPCWATRGATPAPGLNLHGFLLSEVGLGQAARLLAAAADTQSFPLALVHRALPGREHVRDLEERIGAPRPYRASLTVSGLPDLRGLRHEVCRHQHRIVYLYWELSTLPPDRRSHFDHHDTFWAPSRFILECLSEHQDRPVHLVPQPVITPSLPPEPAFAGDKMRVFTFFDYDSFVTRKNPEAVVAAFQTAFPPARRDVELIVKTRGAVDHGRRDWLASRAADDPRLRIVDRTLTRAEMEALLRSSDVFLSLHRSEGFGFGCAEALAHGRAVVATDYGGTTDFVREDTGYPVAWTRVALGKGDYVGWQGATWADPDIDDAAARLRAIYDDTAEARRRAAAGLDHLREHHSPATVGARMTSLLEAEGLV